MKKYVTFSLVFAVFCTLLTGCSKSQDVYNPNQQEQDAQELYKTNFLAYVGGFINNSVDWGFGSTRRVATRATEQPTVVLDDKGYSTEFTDKFFETVQEYFPEGENCKSTDWYNYEFLENGEFFNVRIIYSNSKTSDEIGFYYYDPETETYEEHTKVPLYTDLQERQKTDGDLGYYIQFNRYSKDGLWFGYDVDNGYKIWTEQDAKRIQTRTYTIYMNKTYHFGFYVKNGSKTYYTNQYLNADETAYSGAAIGDEIIGEIRQSYVFGLTHDDTPGCNYLFAIAKDGKDGLYPLLIKPEKKKDPEPEPGPEPDPEPVWYRIIAEDLNAHDIDKDGYIDDTDFDFNDIVLDVALTDDGAKCILQAAGATLKIRINGDDNLEVHKLFGVDQSIMVNTNADKAGLANAKRDPVEFSLKGNFKSVDDIQIQVYRQNNWMTLSAPPGGAASKIVVPNNFVWPDERESLKAKYPDFLNYVKDPEAYREWWNKYNY